MRSRVVILGAGFGGLELAATLADQLDDEVLLVDKGAGFVFGFSKLDVMFGRLAADEVVHPYDAVARPGLSFLSAEVLAIDPLARRVQTTAGTIEAEVLVVALGADLDPAATPGLVEAGYEFYTVGGAFALREVLAGFTGGQVLVGVTSTPFKCPPAPSETVLLMHDYLTDRGVRAVSDITLVMPFGAPIPPSPDASKAVLAAFAERGIGWVPERSVLALDPATNVARLSDGSELAFDLFLGVPVHRAPQVVLDSGMTVNGWIPVDPFTLQTRFTDVYAVGDVTSVGTPKAGVFAEGQAAVAAQHIIGRLRGTGSTASYDGRGLCYLELGAGRVAKVDVTFTSGAAPRGALQGPSVELAADKHQFGTSRAARWFGGSAATG
ncbi:MAG TPA: FAD/NAD(P)-binding oxidoreductase [Candidatus Nanopelagicales bacterium]|nr:FAD/NAD(P)-binding oxidoreductase [Candidatus Nanopelagicales bacterium]